LVHRGIVMIEVWRESPDDAWARLEEKVREEELTPGLKN
jgi:hypothetical protein